MVRTWLVTLFWLALFSLRSLFPFGYSSQEWGMFFLCFQGSKPHVNIEDVQDFCYLAYVVLITGMQLNYVWCTLYAVYNYCRAQNETEPEPSAALAYDKYNQPLNIRVHANREEESETCNDDISGSLCCCCDCSIYVQLCISNTIILWYFSFAK